MRKPRAKTPVIVRIWEKVEKTASCWNWTGAKTSGGYGSVRSDGKTFYPHRIVYEAEVGPLLPGLTIDHLCRNTVCVRPDHLEQVTNRVNILRGTGPSAQNVYKTHCPRGHAYDAENTGNYNGYRACRTCARDKERAKRMAVAS